MTQDTKQAICMRKRTVFTLFLPRVNLQSLGNIKKKLNKKITNSYTALIQSFTNSGMDI